MDQQDEKIHIEEHFILRLPLEQARKIKNQLHTKPEKIKKLIKISLDLNNNNLLVDIKRTRLFGTLRKLPTIIESYKTNICNNKSLLFKTADICHIAECDYEENAKNKHESQHGYCPPLKNIKKKRFRKTLFNKDVAVEAEQLSKELYYLLSTDLAAISSKFEIIYTENNSTNDKKQHEFLFGKLSSDSSEVLVALKFFASGSYQMDIGANAWVGVSQSSVSRSIEEVSAALNSDEIFNEHVKFPSTIRECEFLRENFNQKFGFPGVIGIIDCTHVAIVPPSVDREEHLYVNRKKYHSLNVQLICNSNFRIMNVNARFPGSTHDAFIWNQSRCQDVLRNLYLRTRRSFYLLGDSGYQLRPWLLTPFDGNPEPGTPQFEFNQHLKHTRCLIERCNGLLKMRFRCLLKHRVLHYTPEKAGKIINACIVLHNICVENNMPEPEPELGEDVDYGMYVIGDENMGGAMARVNPELVEGRRIRNLVMNHFQN